MGRRQGRLKWEVHYFISKISNKIVNLPLWASTSGLPSDFFGFISEKRTTLFQEKYSYQKKKKIINGGQVWPSEKTYGKHW